MSWPFLRGQLSGKAWELEISLCFTHILCFTSSTDAQCCGSSLSWRAGPRWHNGLQRLWFSGCSKKLPPLSLFKSNHRQLLIIAEKIHAGPLFLPSASPGCHDHNWQVLVINKCLGTFLPPNGVVTSESSSFQEQHDYSKRCSNNTCQIWTLLNFVRFKKVWLCNGV